MGLYYYKARHYDPQAGRFIQPDPIGYSDGLNMYAYVGNDPVNFSDPSG
ncbi:MAG: RHS repeat-associated core domain-containing protein [Pseudomonadota bacterium]